MVPAITGLIDRLEDRGLVKKERCSEDRRVWHVSITAAGSKLLARIDEPFLDLETGMCSGLTVAECRQLSKLLEKVRNGLEVS